VENDYIVTTSDIHDTHGLDALQWNELHVADYDFKKPFCLRLKDKQVVFCDQVLRLVPGRRMVVAGIWHGKPAVAKLFYDTRAKQHMEKDIAGIRSLQKNKIPTPELLYEGVTEDKKIYVMLLERILESKNLDEIWKERHNTEELVPLLKNIIIEIATQHVLGLLQQDLHLKNFLLTEKAIYTLDGGQIQEFDGLLGKQVSTHNLALFLSQLGMGAQHYQESLFRYYADARGWKLKSEDFTDFFLQIKKCNELRWSKFEKKIFRDSTQFVVLDKGKYTGSYNRQYDAPQFQTFLADPESVFTDRARLLKKGNSATVIKVRLDNRDYVVKRYNMKNIWHRLRRCLRTTRAAHCWRLANKLALFDVATAHPVAYLESKKFGMRGVSYYVTEYVSGIHAGDYLNRNLSKSDKTQAMVKRISDLLKSVAKVDVTHGDLKISNILVNAREQPVLIDLDGAAEHPSLSGLRKAWHKELDRFLLNFKANPGLQKKFEMELAQQ